MVAITSSNLSSTSVGLSSPVELGHVAVEVLRGAVLIDALHSALEDGEEAFNGIGVDCSTAVFTCGMVHYPMRVEELAQTLVVARIGSHHVRLSGDVLLKDRQDCLCRHVVHNLTAGSAGGPVN